MTLRHARGVRLGNVTSPAARRGDVDAMGRYDRRYAAAGNEHRQAFAPEVIVTFG